jgi:hypothetical protein
MSRRRRLRRMLARVARRSPKSSIIRGRIADGHTPAGRAQTFALLQPYRHLLLR